MPQQAVVKVQDTSELLAQQRSDIESISLFMNDVRRELTALKSAVEEVKANNMSAAGRSRQGSGFPKEFDALTDNVSRLNSRIGDLDGLRLEMLVNKRRTQILEDKMKIVEERLDFAASSTQPSHTVTGYTPQSTQGFPIAAPNHGGMANSFPPRPMPQAISGRKEIPDSASSSQVEEIPAPSIRKFAQPPEGPQAGPASGFNTFQASKVADRDRYRVSPEYRARQGPEFSNEINHRPIAPNIPVPPPNQPILTSTFTPVREPHVRSTPPVPINQFTTVNRPIAAARRLNDADVVQVSDPEDGDYAPDSQRPPSPRPITRGPRRGEKVRLPSPDWEKPGWIGPRDTTRTSPRDKPSPRRTVSNQMNVPSPKRRKTTAYEFEQGLPASWTEGSAHSTQQTFVPTQIESTPFHPTPDPNGSFQPSPYPENPHQLETPLRLENELHRSRESTAAKSKDGAPKEKQDLRSVPRTRDEQGRLLRPDGKIDGRSVRYGTPNPKRRASAGVPAAIASKPAAAPSPTAVVTVNSPVPVAVNTPPTTVGPVSTPPTAATTPIAVNSPAAVTTPAAANSPPPPPPPPVSTTVKTPPVTTPIAAAPSPVPTPTPASPWSAPPPPPAPATRQASLREKRKLRRSGGGRDRDEEGNLLNRSGKVDGRSLRYKRAKERAEVEEREGGEEGDGEGDGEGEGVEGAEEGEDGDGRGQLVGD